MFIDPTITRVSLGFSGYIWLNTKIVLKNNLTVGMSNWLCWVDTCGDVGQHCRYATADTIDGRRQDGVLRVNAVCRLQDRIGHLVVCTELPVEAGEIYESQTNP